MPRLPTDYSRTIMYKIVCNDLRIDNCYVGHTTDFTKRKALHKYSCNNENNKFYDIYVYKFIRENGGWSNWSMVQIEEYPCNTSNEACSRERYWLETLHANLNCNIPTRTKQEYNETNKEIINEKNRKYYSINKEELCKKKKEYHDTHKEKIREQKKEYYINNKKIINEKNGEKIECECGSFIRKDGKIEHIKSQKHKSFILSKKESEIEII